MAKKLTAAQSRASAKADVAADAADAAADADDLSDRLEALVERMREVPVVAVAGAFPDPPASGRWTESQHDAAVAAYEAALAVGDPDAGRMRTVLGLFGAPGKELQSGVAWGVARKG